MKMQFLINALLPKLFHVPVVPTFCFYQNWSNHSLPPPTCLSDHILAATNDRHLWAIHGGHRNIGALYLGFLYGFLHFLSEENQTKNCSCGRLGGEIWFHLFHLTSVVMMTTVQFFRVSDISLFFGGGIWKYSGTVNLKFGSTCKSADPSLLRSKKCRHCTNLATELGKSQTWKP